MVKAAKALGTWNAAPQVDVTTVPADLRSALDANSRAQRNWTSYSESMRRLFLRKLASAKRPETRARYVADIVVTVARKVSRVELMERSGFSQKAKARRTTKR
jgi:uncharacterized protein YdeI (YjbR/CyaY-like superfamily)